MNEACQISVVGNLFCIIPLRRTKYRLVISIDMLHLSLTFNGNIAFNLKAKERGNIMELFQQNVCVHQKVTTASLQFVLRGKKSIKFQLKYKQLGD